MSGCPPLSYVTDDRDLPEAEQMALFIQQGGNGDWYVSTVPVGQRPMNGVRLCTSGGASSACPGLTVGIAAAYRAMAAAAAGERVNRPSYIELEEEVRAWREHYPEQEFDDFGIVPKER